MASVDVARGQVKAHQGWSIVWRESVPEILPIRWENFRRVLRVTFLPAHPKGEALGQGKSSLPNIGDACQVPQGLVKGEFCGVMHDPPAQAMVVEIYGLKFNEKFQGLKPVTSRQT